MAIPLIFGWEVYFILKAILEDLIIIAMPMITGAIVSYINGDDFWWYQQTNQYLYAWPRYIKTEENTIVDTFTGLEWIPDPSELGSPWGIPGEPAGFTWAEALQACDNLFFGGHNDWRLPNRHELESITNYGKSNPSIDEDLFPNTPAGAYWSGSMTFYGCDNAWFPYFDTGRWVWDIDLNKEKYVRPVRGVPIRGSYTKRLGRF